MIVDSVQQKTRSAVPLSVVLTKYEVAKGLTFVNFPVIFYVYKWTFSE